MDLDELMKYIDSEDQAKKKGKKNKNKKAKQAKNLNTTPTESCSTTISPTSSNELNPKQLNSTGVYEDRSLEKEIEEFKLKIISDSIKCGLFSKIKPSFSENWLKELVL